MSRFEADPHPVLSPYVHSYWGVTRDLAVSGGSFTVTPDRFLELVFFVGEPPWVEETGTRRPLPACTLIPLLHAPLRIGAGGVVRCVAARLHAWSAGIFFPQVDTSSRAWFDLGASFADGLPAISDAWRQDDRGKLPVLLDCMLLGVLSGARPVAMEAMIAARAFASLPSGRAAAEGTGVVADRQGRSRRQIERRVRALTQRAPKQLSSLVRFQFVRDTLWAHPRKELAALAYEAGYADQAHLTRHFHRYAGQTPGAFLRDSAYLKAALRRQDGEDVAFLQDGQREAD